MQRWRFWCRETVTGLTVKTDILS